MVEFKKIVLYVAVNQNINAFSAFATGIFCHTGTSGNNSIAILLPPILISIVLSTQSKGAE